jgi:hypothetical protein
VLMLDSWEILKETGHLGVSHLVALMASASVLPGVFVGMVN